MAGLTAPDYVQGSSFAKAMDDEKITWDEVALSQYPRKTKIDGKQVPLMGYTMRTPEYRFAKWINRNTGEAIETELYDHTNTHAEIDSLAVNPDYEAL